MIGLDTRVVDPTVETLTVVMEQFFDEVDVGENHPSTAVPLELELVESLTGSGSARTRAQGAALVPLGDVLGEELKVGVPFVADDLSTRETTDWDDLWGRVRKGTGDVLRDGP